jgi:hypothetical protein
VSDKERRGVSTVIGTIIFIGIMFTSIIPMMLVMKQADTVYTKKIHEFEIRDDEREKETIVVYTYPDGQKIKVELLNEGNVPAKIVRVWINDQCNVTDELISSNSEKVLGPFTVSGLLEGTTIDVKVTTDRGNVFYCVSGPLHYTGGGWSTTSYGICVIIHNPQGGEFQIKLWNVTKEPDQWDVFYQSHAKEWEDIVATTPVPEPSSDYEVDIYERKGANWKQLPGSPIPTPIDYPNGPPFILVWVDAK